MKKSIVILVLLGIEFFLFSTGLGRLYNNGKANFKVDKSFGIATEWDMIFPRGVRSITFKKESRFFATSMGGKDHFVFYFNKTGKLIKKIGQKGEGPGDFYHPGDLSILDDKYLIIGEYATKRRISIFDLNGKFVKILRVKSRNCFGVTAISNEKIIYYSYGKKKTESEYEITDINIFIKNINSGKEKRIDILFKNKTKKLKGQGFISLTHYLQPKVFIRKIENNKIMCSFSLDPHIYICSLDGKILKTFKVELEKTKLSEKTKGIIYNYFRRKYKKKQSFFLKIMKRMRNNKTLFRDYYPLYSEITIDSNNILFWEIIKGVNLDKENDTLEIGSQIICFLKYSIDGNLLGRYSIDLSDNKELNFNPKYIFNNAAYVYSDENGLQRILLN